MTKQKPLGDLAMIILTLTARKGDGLVHPLPAAAGKDHLAIARALTSLRKRDLVGEVSVTDERHRWRRNGGAMIGLMITDAGKELVASEQPQDAGGQKSVSDAVPPPKAADGRTTKIAAVIALLRRVEGATLEDLVAATGWLAHTTRAALTGLRKKGHALTSDKLDGVRRYYIASGESAGEAQ